MFVLLSNPYCFRTSTFDGPRKHTREEMAGGIQEQGIKMVQFSSRSALLPSWLVNHTYTTITDAFEGGKDDASSLLVSQSVT